VLRCLLEGLRWLWGTEAVKVAGKSGISQARSRLGEAPLRRLYEQVVQPVATRATKGAWYRGWRLVSLDGSSLDVADTAENGIAFGYPGASRGASAFPQLRFVALVENGTHVLFGARLGGCADGETTLAHGVLPAFRPGMLCLADRCFFGYALWQAGTATGADLLWRVKSNLRLPRATVLADGSYLSVVYPSEKDRRHATNGIQVRVVEYRLEGVADAEPLYRLVTTILDPALAPAADLAALYHERWEVDIDQSWRLSRIKRWVVWTCDAAFRVKPDCGGNPSVAEQQGSTPFECTPRTPPSVSVASETALNNSSRNALQWDVARDGWRSSRTSGWLAWRDRRRQAPPGRRSCPDRLDLGDHGGIGGHQLGRAAAGRNRAAA